MAGLKEKKRKELMSVDHSRIYYRPYRKDFYVEIPELARLTPEGTLIWCIFHEKGSVHIQTVGTFSRGVLLIFIVRKNITRVWGLKAHVVSLLINFFKIFSITLEVDALRAELEGIKVRGKGCPKPIKEWAQGGVSKKVLDTLKK